MQANYVYEDAIIVDAAVPIAPFAAIASADGPESVLTPYVSAGATLAVVTVVDDFPNSIEQTVRLIAANRRFLLQRPESYLLADSVAAVRRAKADHKLAVAFAFQGTNALMGDLALVETYRRLGVIQMLLAYNMGNLAADGCHEGRNGGLTQFGRQLVAEMNCTGMIVDLTHVGVRSSLEALELTTKPAIFSHSSPKRFSGHDRNVTDEQIRACASTDGMVGLTGVGLFMDGDTRRASPSRLAETIDYVAQLVGARHVGIGLDYVADTTAMSSYLRKNAGLYGGGGQYPEETLDFASPLVLIEVATKLTSRGYSAADVRGILGENYLRVMNAVQSCTRGRPSVAQDSRPVSTF
jgi:membrane dipeptidase